ncbi:MAG: hypothetical protein QOJ67_788 [Acidimicrobiaceae bacterium]
MEAKRWHSWSGAVGLALVFVALFLPGPPPKTDDTAAALTANLVEHRTALVDGVLVAGLGVMALLWFFGVLAGTLRRNAGTASFAPTAVVGGVAGTLLIFVGMLLFSGTAFRAAGMGDQTLVRATVDTGNMLIETGKYGFAVMIAATCASASRGGLLSRRMILAGLISALILVLSTIPPFLTDHGVGQFGGGIDVLGGIPGFGWIMALSAQMARRPELT